MFKINLKSRTSIYEQIVAGFKEMIVGGEMRAGDKLPSVRELSSQLTVNPNTIQKAYSALELQGWIYTVSGRGCYVSEDVRTVDEKQINEVYAQIDPLISELIYLGVSGEDILIRLSEIIKERRGAK